MFALNVCSFLVSALVIARTPGSFAERTEAVADGPTARWRDVAADRRRRRLFTVTALSFGAFGVTLVADLPLVDHFGGGAVGYALLTTLWGLGAVAGSLVAGRLPERYERRSLIGGTAAMAIGLGSIAVMPGLAAAIAVGTIGGIGSGMAFTPWFSLLQRGTPDWERGTAFAMAETFEQSSFIAGMVVAGVVVGTARAPGDLPPARRPPAAGHHRVAAARADPDRRSRWPSWCPRRSRVDLSGQLRRS